MAIVIAGTGAITDCASWVTPAELTALGLIDDVGPAVDLELICCAAAKILHELSGRQFGMESVAGGRPIRCSGGCGCGGGYAAGYSGWLTISGAGGWWQGFGGGCGCSDAGGFVIPGATVRSIEAVTIDGVVLDSGAYALYENNLLVRTDGASFPCCQSLSTPDGESGTWSIDITRGSPVPEDGRLAAIELAANLAMALTGGDCQLPDRVTSIVRSGVSMTLLDPAQFLNGGKTGLYLCDLFLSAENPYGTRSWPSIGHPLLDRLAIPR